jgi:hypothetical protein
MKNSKTFAVLLFASLSATVWAADSPTTPTDAVLHKFSKVDTVFDDAVRVASQTRETDPIKFISRDMGTVAGELADYHTGQPVQTKEKEVVSQLDEVIALLEKECKNGKPGGSLNPSKPMPDSKLGGGPGGVHELTDPKASEKVWGNLSPKQREQILQSKTDGFPAGYETLLQSYYKRLAAEQVTDDKSPDKSPDHSADKSGAAPTTVPSEK